MRIATYVPLRSSRNAGAPAASGAALVCSASSPLMKRPRLFPNSLFSAKGAPSRRALSTPALSSGNVV